MNSEHVQNLRYKLQKRVRRLNSLGFHSLLVGMRQFFGFLDQQPMIQGVLDELAVRFPGAKAEAATTLNLESREGYVCYDETENAALCYHVLRGYAQQEKNDLIIGIVRKYERTSSELTEIVDVFRDRFLDPFYEYVDEHLDDQRSVLALLRRYKHKCEWFAREQLYRRWSVDTQWGERGLAQHLYEYLHDQGIDFHIEPQSASGEADLIAMQKTDDPLIADAKIFDPDRSKGKSYIASGFAQVYRYTVDFNEAVGYLVIYQTSARDVRFLLNQKAISTPFVVHNNKTIFLLTIDIYPHEEPASKRGPLNPMEITEDDLIRVADEVKPISPAITAQPNV